MDWGSARMYMVDDADSITQFMKMYGNMTITNRALFKERDAKSFRKHVKMKDEI